MKSRSLTGGHHLIKIPHVYIYLLYVCVKSQFYRSGDTNTITQFHSLNIHSDLLANYINRAEGVRCAYTAVYQ